MTKQVAKVCMVPDLYARQDSNSFFLSGSDLAWNLLGSHNEGLLAASEVAKQLSYLRMKTNKKLFVDAQSGFGNPLNTYFTVKELEHYGADVVLVNDQKYPSNTIKPQKAQFYSFAGRVKAAVDANSQDGCKVWVKLDCFNDYGNDGLQKRLSTAAKLGATGALLNRVPNEVVKKLDVNLKLGLVNPQSLDCPSNVEYLFG